MSVQREKTERINLTDCTINVHIHIEKEKPTNPFRNVIGWFTRLFNKKRQAAKPKKVSGYDRFQIDHKICQVRVPADIRSN